MVFPSVTVESFKHSGGLPSMSRDGVGECETIRGGRTWWRIDRYRRLVRQNGGERDYRVRPRGAKTVELNPGIGGNIVVECRRGHRCGLSSWDHCRGIMSWDHCRGVMSGLSVVETVIAKSQFRIVKHRRVRWTTCYDMLRCCWESEAWLETESIGLETVKPL